MIFGKLKKMPIHQLSTKNCFYLVRGVSTMFSSIIIELVVDVESGDGSTPLTQAYGLPN